MTVDETFISGISIQSSSKSLSRMATWQHAVSASLLSRDELTVIAEEMYGHATFVDLRAPRIMLNTGLGDFSYLQPSGGCAGVNSLQLGGSDVTVDSLDKPLVFGEKGVDRNVMINTQERMIVQGHVMEMSAEEFNAVSDKVT